MSLLSPEKQLQKGCSKTPIVPLSNYLDREYVKFNMRHMTMNDSPFEKYH